MPITMSSLFREKSTLSHATCSILLTMILALAVAAITGCVGATAPTKSSTTPSSAPLQVATSSLPTGSVGATYSTTLAATGGTPPYTWSATSGALPTGLQLSASIGMIAGTPTVSGSSPFTAQVQDAQASVASAKLSVNISPAPAPTISAVSPNSGPIGGGTTVTISGSNFHPGAGVQFGGLAALGVQVANAGQIRAMTPAEPAGVVAVTVQDLDGQISMVANAFNFMAPPLLIATSSLPAGSVRSAYSTTLEATGGTPPYTWSTASGALPAGFQLNTLSGTIAGTPTLAGGSSFTAQVQDAKANSASTALSLKISAVPTSPAPDPVVAISAPTNGAVISGIVTISASASDPQNSIASVQFYLGGSILGPTLTASPYTMTWDTTQVTDGNYNLSARATDLAGNGATSVPTNVTVKNAYWDPSVLGVPWAGDFNPIAANEINVKTDSRLKTKAVGNGAADDTAAIRAAIQLASASGGGVVYFPVGDYKIIAPSNSPQASPIAIPSRVILRGSSATTSRIYVNDPNASSETDWTGTWGGIEFWGSSLSGMTDLGVYAVNSSTSPCALLWNRGSTKIQELFFNNLDVHLDNCRNFWFESTDDLLVQNSHFDGSSLQNGPIYVVGNSNVLFLNNTITYHFGRVQMQNNTNLLMQGNTLTRDAENKEMQAGTAIESGGVELSFGQNVQILNNTIQTLNAPADENNDGEAILTQNSNTLDVLDAGSATATASTTLTDSNALWGPVTASRLAQFPEVVAILTGSATGEWHTIQGINTSTKTLTLSQPWKPVPEVGSLYSIFVWTLANATIQGNILIGNPNGIVLFDGCYNCTVQTNALTNSRGILLRTIDEPLSASLYPEGRRVHQLAIDDKILDNTVSNASGVRPAFIALDTEAFSADYYRGMGMMDVQVGGNILQPYSTNPSRSYSPQRIEISEEGYFPCFLFGPAPVKDPVTTVFQNINFWNNSQSSLVTYSPNFLPYTTKACVNASSAP